MPASFKSDNDAYEAWLRRQGAVVESDLQYKHEKMRKDPFVFLRATFFRWARQIEALCPELKEAPQTLCVGDVHIENFGTWRDVEGRLVWGINDFDEATTMPYVFDLVRLAASARLAPALALRGKEAAAALLEGYGRGLKAPRPTLLDEQETWMRPYVACSDAERAAFWKEVAGYPAANPPERATAGLLSGLPADATDVRYASRIKGSGSLGRPRYVAVAAWRGGHVVREAKAVVTSAWDWAHARESLPTRLAGIATAAFRSPDPWFKVEGGFVFRRVAADARKVEFADGASDRLQFDLVRAMGFDLGSIHASGPEGAAVIRRDLDGRPADWLFQAAKVAAAAVEEDYRSWKG